MFIASIFVVGCLTGSLVGGYQCDYLGRRRSMMLDCGLMVLGFLAISLAPGWELLLLGRLLTGHSSGSNLVATPIFTSEICEPSVRGAASVLTMVCYTSGFFLSMLAGAALPWRTAAAVFVVTAVASFVLLIFCKVGSFLSIYLDLINTVGISDVAADEKIRGRSLRCSLLLPRRQ